MLACSLSFEFQALLYDLQDFTSANVCLSSESGTPSLICVLRVSVWLFGSNILDFEALLLECLSMYAVFAPSYPRISAQPCSPALYATAELVISLWLQPASLLCKKRKVYAAGRFSHVMRPVRFGLPYQDVSMPEVLRSHLIWSAACVFSATG